MARRSSRTRTTPTTFVPGAPSLRSARAPALKSKPAAKSKRGKNASKPQPKPKPKPGKASAKLKKGPPSSSGGVTKEKVFQTLLDAIDVAGIAGGKPVATKAMFGGICAWIDGPPKVGTMVAGVTSKCDVCLRAVVGTPLRAELDALGGRPMMPGRAPWLLVSRQEFHSDKARRTRWLKTVAEDARSGVSASAPTKRATKPAKSTKSAAAKATAAKAAKAKSTRTKRARATADEPVDPAPQEARATKRHRGTTASQNKTMQSDNAQDVEDYVAALATESQQKEARRLIELCEAATGEPARMWGSIVGFGTYHYVYDSGRSGDWMVIGFAMRSKHITLYAMDGLTSREQLLQRMGKHRHGKSCLHFKSLATLEDQDALVELIQASVEAMRAKYAT